MCAGQDTGRAHIRGNSQVLWPHKSLKVVTPPQCSSLLKPPFGFLTVLFLSFLNSSSFLFVSSFDHQDERFHISSSSFCPLISFFFRFNLRHTCANRLSIGRSDHMNESTRRFPAGLNVLRWLTRTLLTFILPND